MPEPGVQDGQNAGHREAHSPGGDAHLKGLAMVAGAHSVFGSMGFFYKIALAGGATTLTILPLRFLLATLPIWGIVLVSGRRARLPLQRVLGLVAMGGGCYVGQSYLFLAALEFIPLSTATLILLIYPALVMTVALALGRERATAARLAALGLSLLGAVLVVGGPGAEIHLGGALLAFGSAVVYATYLLVGDRVLRGIDPLVGSGYITSSAAVGFIILAVGFGAFTTQITLNAWLAILVVAWFCTVLGVTGLLAGLSMVGPSAASIVGMLEPFVAVTLGVVVLGEQLSPAMVAGGVAIAGAVILLRKPSAPVLAPQPRIAKREPVGPL